MATWLIQIKEDKLKKTKRYLLVSVAECAIIKFFRCRASRAYARARDVSLDVSCRVDAPCARDKRNRPAPWRRKTIMQNGGELSGRLHMMGEGGNVLHARFPRGTVCGPGPRSQLLPQARNKHDKNQDR